MDLYIVVHILFQVSAALQAHLKSYFFKNKRFESKLSDWSDQVIDVYVHMYMRHAKVFVFYDRLLSVLYETFWKFSLTLSRHSIIVIILVKFSTILRNIHRNYTETCNLPSWLKWLGTWYNSNKVDIFVLLRLTNISIILLVFYNFTITDNEIKSSATFHPKQGILYVCFTQILYSFLINS